MRVEDRYSDDINILSWGLSITVNEQNALREMDPKGDEFDLTPAAKLPYFASIEPHDYVVPFFICTYRMESKWTYLMK